MTPEELAQKQLDREIQDELIQAIWITINGVTCQYDKVNLDSVISALEVVKTKHIINTAVVKAITKMDGVKDATIQP